VSSVVPLHPHRRATAGARIVGKTPKDDAHLRLIPRRHEDPMLLCMHCGEKYATRLPAPIDITIAVQKTFTKMHRRCRLTELGSACTYCYDFGHEPKKCPKLNYAGDPRAWLNGPDTGMSSETLWRRLMGYISLDPTAPSDPEDFGRAHRLLHAIPGWRARIGEAASLPHPWPAYVAAWDELEALYLEEEPTGNAPKLWARMKELRGET
jgi:hypothetical protein